MVKGRHWFGSLVNTSGVWTKQNGGSPTPLVVRGGTASFQSPAQVQKCGLPVWDWERRGLTGGGAGTPPTTAPAQMTDSSGGPRLTRERQGSGVTGGWTHWHLRGPTNILESSSTSFKSERGATYLTFLFTFSFSFPLALFRGFGPVFEKVLLRYQYIEETF